MAFIKWSEDYLVGNDKLDNQHKNIFFILCSLEELLLAGKKNQEKTNDLLQKFLKTALDHFDFEERLMTENQYPESDSHIKQHFVYRQKLENQINEFSAGRLELAEFFKFAKMWWIAHVAIEDQKYKGCIPKQAI